MNFPEAPKNMLEHRSSTLKNFGYDNCTDSQYRFNSLGYRSDIEFVPRDDAIWFLGNSITFGIGLDLIHTFPGMVSQQIKAPVYNFSWGCVAHTNLEYLEFVRSLLTVSRPRMIFYQINNLDCYRQDGRIVLDKPVHLLEEEFRKFHAQLEAMMLGLRHKFLYWDNVRYGITLPNCLVDQKYQVDRSLPHDAATFGKKSHRLIGLKILDHLKLAC